MSKQKILITGVTGFIGSNLVSHILKKKYDISAIIRPKTQYDRIKKLKDKIKLVKIDLTDINKLRTYLKEESFDSILHIGALRGGRSFSKSDFFNANVNATEQLIINALKNDSNFIFCSSVGVFGAIPKSVPASENTPRQEDNYYHYTKIQAENIIQKYILQGLRAAIIRPSITYGIPDYGFPYNLVKLIDKKQLFLPKQEFKIHLTNVDTLCNAFLYLLENSYKTGKSYIVADSKPVIFQELVHYISRQLHNKDYPKSKFINRKFFHFGEKIAQKLNNELWTSRFQLISRPWYYDVEKAYKELKLSRSETIPKIKKVIEWYQKNRD